MPAIYTKQSEVFSRGYQTKTEIARAFDRLCIDTAFSRISTEAIAKEANVGRSTFYRYFSDKNEVVQWLSLLCYANGLDQIGRSLNWFEGHLNTTRGFRQFKYLLTAASKSTEYGGGVPFFIRHRQQNITETIVDFQKLELTTLLAIQIEALPYAEQLIGNNYHKGIYDISIREYCDTMISLVPRELFDALNNPVHPDSFNDNFLTLPQS